MSWKKRIDDALQIRRQQQRFRSRTVLTPDGTGWVQHNGRRYRNFSSNDYLGLSNDIRIIHAWQQGAMRYGVGAGASGHIAGYLQPHADLEEELADWLGYPCALLFTSGYAANQAVIIALLTSNDCIYVDKMSHASVLEAAKFSPAILRRFVHNQPESLRRLLNSSVKGETLVVTEGVFSMNGDIAPISVLHQITKQANGWLLVDDAHGIGVKGAEGRGSCWQQNIKPELLIITFGKAFGISGAALLCSCQTADYLLQFSRHLIYSTAMSPAQVEALRVALHIVRQSDDLREQLQKNIIRFCIGAKQLGLTWIPSNTAIQSLIIGDDAQALAFAERLRKHGCWVTAIRPPTVPPGTARIRITLTACHKTEDIDWLLEALYDTKSE